MGAILLSLKNPNHPYCQVFFRWLHHFQGAQDSLSVAPHFSLIDGDHEPVDLSTGTSLQHTHQALGPGIHKQVLFSPPWAGDSARWAHHVSAYLLPLVQTPPSPPGPNGSQRETSRNTALSQLPKWESSRDHRLGCTNDQG